MQTSLITSLYIINLSLFYQLCSSSLSFLFLGDWGFTGENQTLIANQMNDWSGNHNPSFVIMLGDNFYYAGVSSDTDPQWESTYRAVYSLPNLLNIPFYAILGNHDYIQNPQAQIDYFANKRDNRWVMPDHVYSRVYPIEGCSTNNCQMQVVFIDTSILAPNEFPETSTGGIHEVSDALIQSTLGKIESFLSTSSARWLLVAGHYTIYSTAEHGDTSDLINRLVPLMKRYGVQLYMNGHDHTLQHISWQGVEYVTSGHGTYTNGFPYGFFKDEPSSVASAGLKFRAIGPGFSTAQVTEDTLTFQFIDKNGNNLYSSVLTNPRSLSASDGEGDSDSSAGSEYSLQFIEVTGIICLFSGIIIGVVAVYCLLKVRNKPTSEVALSASDTAHLTKKRSKGNQIISNIYSPVTVKDCEEEEEDIIL